MIYDKPRFGGYLWLRRPGRLGFPQQIYLPKPVYRLVPIRNQMGHQLVIIASLVLAVRTSGRFFLWVSTALEATCLHFSTVHAAPITPESLSPNPYMLSLAKANCGSI